MPYMMRTPEEIFRTEGKDIYIIRFADGEAESPARTQVMEWLRDHVPHTPMEPLAPSEYSGYIMGYLGDLRVDFSDEALRSYCARWETPDGDSIDPRFQCYQIPYESWLAKAAQYPATTVRPTSVSLTIWIESPRGIFYHQLPPNESEVESLKRHPCSYRDFWFNVVNLVPTQRDLDIDKLTYGQIAVGSEGEWVMLYSAPLGQDLADERRRAILGWFNLPPDTEVSLDY